MQFTNNKLKIYALLGVVGGALFMIGDCLIFCYEGLGSSGVQPLWAHSRSVCCGSSSLPELPQRALTVLVKVSARG